MGMHMTWTLPPDLPSATEIQRVALSLDVGLCPLPEAAAYEQGAFSRFWDRAIVLGYTTLCDNEIREAIARVAVALGERQTRSEHLHTGR